MKKPDWVKNNRVLIACIGSAIVVLVTLDRVIPDWIGFGADSTKNIERNAKGEVTKTIEIQQSGKTFWDWLGLLGVPLVLAGLGYWYQDREKKREVVRLYQERVIETNRQNQLQDIAKGNRQDEILKNYFEGMKELLLDKGLSDSKEVDDQVRALARILTLTVLRQLDHTRNILVIPGLFHSK